MMERLTKRSEDKNSKMVWFVDKESWDMRYEPCEMDSHQRRKVLCKLADYEDAEEQGLLLRLPCKVGDEIYWLDHQNFINKSIVNCIYVECGLGGIRIETLTCDLCLNELGKTVFLTKEEAEKALEDMKGKV